MATIHQATLTPTKLELLTAWLPGRHWYPEEAITGLQRVAACRFDDPDGEVGLEALLVRGDGPLLHVPLSYRAAPLPGAEPHLVGTAEHSVLGTRYVYDGCADPVWVSALAKAVLAGGRQAALEYEDENGRPQRREPTTTVAGSGDPGSEVPRITAVTCRDEAGLTVVHAGHLELAVVRTVGATVEADETLTGRWPGGDGVLAGVSPATR